LARAGGSREVFIATETTEAFFGGLGFAGVGGLDSLPAAFRQHMGFCAETAVVMRFVL
jgi:N-acetylglutamate synthase-like GNAT family acetyltransferase